MTTRTILPANGAGVAVGAGVGVGLGVAVGTGVAVAAGVAVEAGVFVAAFATCDGCALPHAATATRMATRTGAPAMTRFAMFAA